MLRRSHLFGPHLAILAVVPLVAWSARADEPKKSAMACSRCGAVTTAERCPKDGGSLVRSDLLLLQAIVAATSKSPRSPFANLLNADFTIKVDELEKLVRDYAQEAKKAPFGEVYEQSVAPNAELACRTCGRPVAKDKLCAVDGGQPVAPRLLLLHAFVLEGGGYLGKDGHTNPLAACVKDDMTVDAGALAKLVADYKASATKLAIDPEKFNLDLDPGPVAKRGRREMFAAGVADAVDRAERKFRHKSDRFGTLAELVDAKLIAGDLAKGVVEDHAVIVETRKNGAAFLVAVSPRNADAGRFFFFYTNAGTLHSARKAFAVPKDTAEVPPGLKVVRTVYDPTPLAGFEDARVGLRWVHEVDRGAVAWTEEREIVARYDDALTVKATYRQKNGKVDTAEEDVPILGAVDPRVGLETGTRAGTETLEVGGTKFECRIDESTGVDPKTGKPAKVRRWVASRFPFLVKEEVGGKAVVRLASYDAPKGAPPKK